MHTRERIVNTRFWRTQRKHLSSTWPTRRK